MIEVIIKNYLAEKLSVPVVLAIQSYAPSMYEAARLNERVKAAMDSAAELDAVSASRLNSDYNFTDTTTKRYRYQAVYDLVYFNE